MASPKINQAAEKFFSQGKIWVFPLQKGLSSDIINP